MCGRFTLAVDPNKLQEAFPWADPPQQYAPRYNIAPTQPVMVIPNNARDKIEYFVWGLVPSWAKDPAIGSRLINARAETLAEKPAFRNAFRRRRCLILADGFYEWRAEPGSKAKTPMYIRKADGLPFAFAGLWENWTSPDSSNLLTTTIITTEPNELLSNIHNRMPVILPEEAYDTWLAEGELPLTELQPLLIPYPDNLLTAFPVSRLVNSPQNDLPDCVLPLAE
jgi:putative SOS response-associated peptidase YedK